MKAYSMDLRERVLRACLQKQSSQRKIAERFGVSRSWLEKLLRRYHKTGSLAPLPQGGDYNSVFTGQHLERLKQILDEHPDATLTELGEHCGVNCSKVAVWRTLKKLGYTRKKDVTCLRTRPPRCKSQTSVQGDVIWGN